jgi:hypothetical protein
MYGAQPLGELITEMTREKALGPQFPILCVRDVTAMMRFQPIVLIKE